MVRILHVTGYGVSIGFSRGSLRVRSKSGETSVPLNEVDVVVVASSGVSISSKAVRWLVRSGVEVVVLDHRGDPVGILYSSHYTRTPETRRAQYEALHNGLGARIAAEIAYSKVASQACHLRSLASRGEARLRPVYRELESYAEEIAGMEAGDLESTRKRLVSIEAAAARIYWQGVADVLPRDLGFEGRDRYSLDPVNSSLNYGYGILYSLAWRSLVMAGLDPYAGFLHVDRSGKPVLAFDYVEMFRVAAVDRPLVETLRRGWRPRLDNGRLDYRDRERIAGLIASRLGEKARGAYRAMSLDEAIRGYSLRLAKCLRDKSPFQGYRGC